MCGSEALCRGGCFGDYYEKHRLVICTRMVRFGGWFSVLAYLRFQPIGLFPKCGSPNILLKLTWLRFELHAVLFPGKAIRELPIY